jgi:ketosteroid isomerase-like protein
MSEENVELVKAAYDVFATSGPEAFSDYWADNIEWEAIGGRFRGRDAGRAYMQTTWTAIKRCKPWAAGTLRASALRDSSMVAMKRVHPRHPAGHAGFRASAVAIAT